MKDVIYMNVKGYSLPFTVVLIHVRVYCYAIKICIIILIMLMIQMLSLFYSKLNVSLDSNLKRLHYHYNNKRE